MNYHTRAYERLLSARNGSGFYMERANELETVRYEVDLPDTWVCSYVAPWINCVPTRPHRMLPEQGWKVHVSTTIETASQVLELVSQICIKLKLPFKFLIGERAFFDANAKYADRAGAGKFITIYPTDDAILELLVSQLDKQLSDFCGPYILSDVKVGKGPLFVRYGAFVQMYTDNLETPTPAIRTPSGDLIEDIRAPWFVLPEFVKVPQFLSSAVRDRLRPKSGEVAKLIAPYEVVRGLHFSNAGGVYELRDLTSGKKAVMKEGRSWAGLTSRTSDGRRRVEREGWALRKLQGSRIAPELLREFTVGDHALVMQEFVEGAELDRWVADNFPINYDSDDRRIYEETACIIAKNLADIITRLHELGVAHLDIQPRNILVTANLDLVLVDFETAALVDGRSEEALGTPGFTPRITMNNEFRDLYGIARVTEYLFCPSLAGNFLQGSERKPMLNSIEERFGTAAATVVDSAFERLSSDSMAYAVGPFVHCPYSEIESTLSKSLVTGLYNARKDNTQSQTFTPGDIAVFDDLPVTGLSIENGACGVLLAMSRQGCALEEMHHWVLTDGVRRLREYGAESREGLLRGLPGMLGASAEAGLLDIAYKFLDTYVLNLEVPDATVRTGLAGTLLGLLWARQFGVDVGIDQLYTVATVLEESFWCDRLTTRSAAELGSSVGLFDGWVGVGLAFNAMYRVTGEVRWKTLALSCCEREIEGLEISEHGKFQLNQSGVRFIYLSEGAAGIALGLAVIDLANFRKVIHDLQEVMRVSMSLNGGLFNGLLGVACVNRYLATRGEEDMSISDRQMKFVLNDFLYRKVGRDGLYMLGDHSYALSGDLASGSSGLIAALSSWSEGGYTWFPCFKGFL